VAAEILPSLVFAYSFSYGGNKLFYLSLLKLQEKIEIKIGPQKLFDHLKKLFLGNVFAGRALHGL
jgi:hypothetical protein